MERKKPLFITDLYDKTTDHCRWCEYEEEDNDNDDNDDNDMVGDIKFLRIVTNLDIDNKDSKFLETQRIHSKWAVFFLANA